MMLILAVLAGFVIKVRACRSHDDWSVLAAIGLVFTHALLEFPLEQAYFLLPLGLLMGSFTEPTRGILSAPLLARSMLAAASALLVLLFMVGAEYLRIEQANRSVRLALFGVGELSQNDAEIPKVYLLDAPREYMRLMVTPARLGMTEDELNWMRAVTQRHAFPPAMMRYALAAGLNGRMPEAQLTLQRLCAMHSPDRCAESLDVWSAAQRSWPQLGQAIP
jgi:hypothetical protein